MNSTQNFTLFRNLLVADGCLIVLKCFLAWWDYCDFQGGLVLSFHQPGWERALLVIMLTMLLVHVAGLVGMMRLTGWGRIIFLCSVLFAQLSVLFKGFTYDIPMMGLAPNLANRFFGTGFGWPVLDGAILALAFFLPMKTETANTQHA